MPFVLKGLSSLYTYIYVYHYVFLNDWTRPRSPLFKWMSLAIFFWNGFYVRHITLTLKGQSCWDVSKRYSISLIPLGHKFIYTHTRIYIYIAYKIEKETASFPSLGASLGLWFENLVTYKNMNETRRLGNEFQVTVSHSRWFWWRRGIGKSERGRIGCARPHTVVSRYVVPGP